MGNGSYDSFKELDRYENFENCVKANELHPVGGVGVVGNEDEALFGGEEREKEGRGERGERIRIFGKINTIFLVLEPFVSSLPLRPRW